MTRSAVPRSARRPLGAAALSLLALSSFAFGCAPNTYVVRTDVEAARLLVDGSETTAPEPGKPRSFPYFGTLCADLEPSEGPKADYVRQPVRVLAELAPPAPGWLFPLDLPIEAIHRMLHGPAREQIVLSAPARPGTVVGTFPVESQELKQRAAAMRTAR